jgi:hypothetical protein
MNLWESLSFSPVWFWTQMMLSNSK